MKNKERKIAAKLRNEGKSYGEIKKKVKVSQGTLSLWLRDIKLTKEQKERIKKKQSLGVEKAAKIKKQHKRDAIEETLKEAETEFKKLKSNPVFLSGLMLYWAEGSKSKRGEDVMFTNSDTRMIKFMIMWFRKFCGISDSRFRISMHIHELHSRKDIERYWSKITGIPKTQFYKTQIKPTALQHRKNKLYNGTCVVKIHNKELFRRIQGWIEGFNKINHNFSKSPRSSTDRTRAF